jgi:hypothetical protein
MQLKRYFMQMFDDEKNCIPHYSIMCFSQLSSYISTTFCMNEVSVQMMMSLRVKMTRTM